MLPNQQNHLRVMKVSVTRTSPDRSSIFQPNLLLVTKDFRKERIHHSNGPAVFDAAVHLPDMRVYGCDTVRCWCCLRLPYGVVPRGLYTHLGLLIGQH
jgi:hypothetical protein